MNTLDELEEIKELVNDNKHFKYKAIVNFNCEFIKKELEYAKNCHELEEELGCPLEVVAKLRKANYIYRDDGLVFGFIGINFNDEDKLILYNDDEFDTFTSDLKLADYKKTWFLKKDKSE